jgi:hypothetical protein
MQTFRAIAGQSIYDVCLNTYGTLDYLFKIMQDNSFLNLNTGVYSGQLFTWDDSLVFNQAINANYLAGGKLYSTDISNNGSVFYVAPSFIPGGGPGPIGPSFPPALTPKTYQMVYNTSYTAGADGQTVITPLDISGGSLIGFDIVQITKEIKQLTTAQFIWNKPAGVLTLTGGLSMANLETLFILYSKIVTL